MKLLFIITLKFISIKHVYLVMIRLLFILIAIQPLFFTSTQAQLKPLPSNEIEQGLKKLNTLGSVLYFAAHPDDENTRLIAWLAQEKNYRTAYLSLTRGDGGQNLIGTDQGIDLGLIRTQELIAARKIDKGEQLFTSAYDFGFSKTHEETFSFWDKETALREAVWLIRKYRPDIIINRFPPDPRGGHGHHQASAILAQEAFRAAADPNAFPDQLKHVEPWQATRLLWNTANFGGQNNTREDQLKIDIGTYNPLLGKSYGEIAAQSRSQHRSQGFGAASSRGRYIEYFELVDGEQANVELMEGIETTWKRIPNSRDIQKLIDKLIQEFRPNNPERSIPSLLELRTLISKIEDNYWKLQKTNEINTLIVACAGLSIEAYSPKPQYPINKTFQITIEAVVQNPNVNIELLTINGTTVNKKLTQNHIIQEKESMSWATITQPYWLISPHSLGKFEVEQDDLGFPTNPNKPSVDLLFKINNQDLKLSTDIMYKSVDPVLGELYQDISIAPSLVANFLTKNNISVNAQTQNIAVTFTRIDKDLQKTQVKTNPMAGWDIQPNTIDLNFEDKESITIMLKVKPLVQKPEKGNVSLIWNNQPLHGIKTIEYDHIPTLTWYPLAEAQIQNIEIITPVKQVAYIAGAGDLIPESLNQIGIETTLLKTEQVSLDALKRYDAVIVGVRFFNVNKDAHKISKIIMQYVEQGGTALFQYNVNIPNNKEQIGPYPFDIGRNRVTEEDAAVQLDTTDPAMNYPNKLSSTDFDNWIQERGLYFAENIDSRYRTPLQMNDKNEATNPGSLLIVNYGKGKFVYTSLSFFRQLPAGIPGAYRLFVNLLSKEK